GAELKVFRLRRRTKFLPSAARPYSPRVRAARGPDSAANVTSMRLPQPMASPAHRSGGVVQADGVILTLRAASRNRPQALALRANHARGVLRRLGRVALWVIGGFTVGSVLLVALYRYVPPPGTPLMLLRRVEGYGLHKSWSSFDHLS